jgi:poly-gamma-glutamate synthesis protein (capsule biosynthesis protein)
MPDSARTLAFVGDLMLGRGVSAAAATRSAVDFWGDVRPLLGAAAAVIGNLECPITTSGTGWRTCWKAFRFRAAPAAIELLTAANVRALALANNHILDQRARGLSDTLAHLDRAGIAHAGAGRHLEEAVTPALVNLPGLTLGMIALTNTMPEFAAGPSRPGTNYVRISARGAPLALVGRLVRELRAAGADLVILSAHWGPNLRWWPPAHYRAFARAAIALGVDLFHGHSAHLFQGVELHGRGVILYDTGNFLDDYWIFPFVRTDWSFLFLLDLEQGRPTGLRLAPVVIDNARVRLATPSEAARLRRCMERRSRRFGTRFARVGDSLTLRLPVDESAAPTVRSRARSSPAHGTARAPA